jgi:hypothetical protein
LLEEDLKELVKQVKGETEEDVLRSAVEHDVKEHGKTNKDIMKLKDKLKGFIYTIYH